MNFLYFDPGVGAMILQGIIAGVAGVLLFSKNLWYKVKAFLGITKESDDMYDEIDVEENENETDEKFK